MDEVTDQRPNRGATVSIVTACCRQATKTNKKRGKVRERRGHKAIESGNLVEIQLLIVED
jgi:hypothetical protein